MAFTRLDRGPRLSDAIADQLLEAILSGQFREGDPLPSERELGEQFGVSRTVVREAIRTLMTRGIVEARSGRGVRVLRLDSAPVTEAMSLLLRGSPELTFSKVHEVRTTLETDIAALAAERASEAEIAELERLVEQAEATTDLEVESQLDVEFHRAIARSAENELYLVLIDSIGGVLLENRRATLAIPHNQERVLTEHKSIVEAIKSHDAAEARRAMDLHLSHAADAWRTRSDSDCT